MSRTQKAMSSKLILVTRKCVSKRAFQNVARVLEQDIIAQIQVQDTKLVTGRAEHGNMKKHIKCNAGCGCGDGYFNNFQEAKAKHDGDMWAYEMPHEYSPVEINDATGKQTKLDKNTGKPLNENIMKKSELKQLIKAIVTEIHAVKAQRLEETKGLSGFKKTSDKVEHTEDIADSKNLTPNSEPKEKEEGKKLPVVKKPATPSTGTSLKEEILGMVREALEQSRTDEMARTAGAIASKFKKEVSPGNWVVSGHPSIPDGTPTDAPKGPYVPKGIAGMGRPKKGAEPAVAGQATAASVPLIVSAVMPDGKSVQLDYDFINNTWPAAKKYIEQEVMSELPDALDPNVKIGQSVYDKIEAAKELEIDGKLNQSNNKITLSFDKASKQLIAK